MEFDVPDHPPLKMPLCWDWKLADIDLLLRSEKLAAQDPEVTEL
jgi:hypothetical protein